MPDTPDQNTTYEDIPLWDLWPYRALSLLVALVIFSMMSLTFLDVMGRKFFNAPIIGAYEMIEFLISMAVFSGLPLVTATKSHITVSLFGFLIRGRLRWIQDLGILIISAIVVAFVGYRLWQQGESLRSAGMITQVLKAPIAPIAYFASVLCAISCIIIMVMIWRHLTRGKPTADSNEG